MELVKYDGDIKISRIKNRLLSFDVDMYRHTVLFYDGTEEPTQYDDERLDVLSQLKDRISNEPWATEKYNIWKDYLNSHSFFSGGRHFTGETHRCLIWLNDVNNVDYIDVVSHELLHVAFYILDNNSIVMDRRSINGNPFQKPDPLVYSLEEVFNKLHGSLLSKILNYRDDSKEKLA